MGAVGILTAWQLMKHIKRSDSPQRRIDIKVSSLLPLGAGAALVGMFSGGKDTDVSAHVMGFTAGLFLTLLFAMISSWLSSHGIHMDKKCRTRHADTLFLLITAGAIVLAWLHG